MIIISRCDRMVSLVTCLIDWSFERIIEHSMKSENEKWTKKDEMREGKGGKDHPQKKSEKVISVHHSSPKWEKRG